MKLHRYQGPDSPVLRKVITLTLRTVDGSSLVSTTEVTAAPPQPTNSVAPSDSSLTRALLPVTGLGPFLAAAQAVAL